MSNLTRRRKSTTAIIPLTTTNKIELNRNLDAGLLRHLHANNLSANPVLIEIHLGDITQAEINTLLVAFEVPALGAESVPPSLTNIGLAPNTLLTAQASVANVANVVINVSEPEE